MTKNLKLRKEKTKAMKNLLSSLAVTAIIASVFSAPLIAQDRPGDLRVRIDVTTFEPTEPILAALDAFDLVEMFAVDAREHAATLKSFTRQPNAYSAQSHAAKLNRLRAEVNGIADQLERLESLDVTFLPRQELALEHIRPDAAVLVSNTVHAIEFLNENRGERWAEDYETYISEAYERADRIAEAARMAESRLNVQEYLESLSEDSDD